MPFGTSLFLWLRDSETARWIVGIGAALIALLTWDRLRTNRIRREARAKAEKAARKAQTKAIREIEEEADERIEKAKQARASVPDTDVLDSMSDDEYEFLFGRKRNG